MPASGPTSLRRAFQWDLARQQERLDVLLTLLPKYAEWGFQELYLHLEDSVEYPSLPGVARKHAYSHAQLGKLVDAAAKVGIGVVPIVNLLGHTQYLIKVPELRELNELRDASGDPLVQGQICPLHPRTLEVAERLIGDMAPFCTAGKLHAGLDESFHLGKCPRCRADVERHGLAGHFAGHLNRLHERTTARGLRLAMWADMLALVPEAIDRLPTDVAVYDWYYYPFRRHPRIELRNFQEVDLSERLNERGIEHWGCPMNGAFRWEPLPLFSDRLANIRSWWSRCGRTRASGMLICSWEAYRLAFELTTVVDAAAASLWSDGEELDDRAMLEQGFRRVFGDRAAAKSAQLALQADAYPFAGYARWEIHGRWDVRTSSTAVASAEREVRHFRSLVRRAGASPAPLRASLDFRLRAAEREAFVARAAQGVFKLRRLLSRGRRSGATVVLQSLEHEARQFALSLRAAHRAAAALWRRTRPAEWPSQNAALLGEDRRRLAEWRQWLRRVLRDPDLCWTRSLLCGAWQVGFTVVNIAPALQRISVEQQAGDGTWKELHGRHTIEFQAAAATSRACIRRPFAVAVDAPAQPGRDRPVLPRLRIVLRGLGKVRIEGVEITDGVTVLTPRARSRRTLGHPPPTRGLPPIGDVQDVWELSLMP